MIKIKLFHYDTDEGKKVFRNICYMIDYPYIAYPNPEPLTCIERFAFEGFVDSSFSIYFTLEHGYYNLIPGFYLYMERVLIGRREIMKVYLFASWGSKVFLTNEAYEGHEEVRHSITLHSYNRMMPAEYKMFFLDTVENEFGAKVIRTMPGFYLIIESTMW